MNLEDTKRRIDDYFDNISEEEFLEKAVQYGLIGNKELLFFSKGETCEPCIEVQQYLDDRGVSGYSKLNPFEEIDLSIQHNIKNIPTLVLLEDGVEIKRVVGAKVKLNTSRFDKLIELYNKE